VTIGNLTLGNLTLGNLTLGNLTLWARPAWSLDRRIGNERSREERWAHFFAPAAEIVKDGDDAVVRVELPGIDTEKDVNVEIDKGALVIQGERRDEHSEENGGRTLREVRYGSFRRTFALPSHVDDDAVTASYEAGVLTARVAGAYAGSKPRRIEITK
jgi:HSP20 family molecular chaperone IbpA